MSEERWQDSLSDDVRENPTLGKFKTQDDLAKSYVELERRQSRSLVMPGDEATDDAWDSYYTKAQESGHLTVHPDHATDEQAKAFWKAAGVPDDGGYTPPEDFNGLPDEYVKNLTALAVKAGWTNKQFQATLGAMAEDHAEQTGVQDQARSDDRGVVDKVFGLAKKQKLKAIGALAEQFIDPNNPPVWAGDLGKLSAGDLIFMDNVVKAFSGKGPQAFRQPDAEGNQYTPGELDEMIDNLTTDLSDNGRKMTKDKYNAKQAKRMRYIKMRGAIN